MLDNLKQITVADIAAYDTWAREERRKELIASFRGLYGDKVPENAAMQIDRELGAIKSMFADSGDVSIDPATIQFLLWRSVIKTDPKATLEQVGDAMTISKLQEYTDQIMPTETSIGDDEKNGKAPL